MMRMMELGPGKQGIQLLIKAGAPMGSLSTINRYPRLHPIIHGDHTFREELYRVLCMPLTLQQACRGRIRQSLGNGNMLHNDVESLEIPSTLKDYLLIPELSEDVS